MVRFFNMIKKMDEMLFYGGYEKKNEDEIQLFIFSF